MNQKEKAIELINMFYVTDIEHDLYGITKLQAIKCALIFVVNILEKNNCLMHDFKEHMWWCKVKIEISKQYCKCEKDIKEQKIFDKIWK